MDPGHSCGPSWGRGRGGGQEMQSGFPEKKKRKARMSWLDLPSLLFPFGLEDNFADPLAYEQSIVVNQTTDIAFEGID